MESLSRSSGDEDELRRAQGSSQRAEMTGKSGEQKPGTPTTPRSKHSATEQRRRCKINDRFQVLRDLIPHSDQKRDKASFLLEVIEYIKFLQEKVQKYETFPSWNQENEKLIPWSNNQGGPRESITDPSNLAKNGPQSGLLFAGKFVDNTNLGAQMSLSNMQNVAEADVDLVPMQSNYYASVGRGSDFMQPQERLITDSENLVSHSQSEWQGSSCMADCTVGCENEQELTIDEGTISFSSVYSHGLLSTLSQVVASSGLDLSQASISVQINLGRRAIKRPTNTNVSNAKDLSDPSIMNQVIGVPVPVPGSNFLESEQTKRQKTLTVPSQASQWLKACLLARTGLPREGCMEVKVQEEKMAGRRTNLHCLFGENLLENGNKKSIKSFSLEQTKEFKIARAEGFILIHFSLESNKYYCGWSDERKNCPHSNSWNTLQDVDDQRTS